MEMEADCGKTSWPEVVGMSIEIVEDKPDAEIVVCFPTPDTKDFRPNGVHIFVETVAKPPRAG